MITLTKAPPQMPEGDYLASCLWHETAIFATTPKVYIWFQIVDGKFTGTQLYAAYRVTKIKGKSKKGGAFELRHSSALYRELVMLFGPSKRPDRVSLRKLRNCVLRISVRTVTKDYRQKKLPEVLQYSVVDAMKAIEAGPIKQ